VPELKPLQDSQVEANGHLYHAKTTPNRAPWRAIQNPKMRLSAARRSHRPKFRAVLEKFRRVRENGVANDVKVRN
jgi:hypothetical protein